MNIIVIAVVVIISIVVVIMMITGIAIAIVSAIVTAMVIVMIIVILLIISIIALTACGPQVQSFVSETAPASFHQCSMPTTQDQRNAGQNIVERFSTTNVSD